MMNEPIIWTSAEIAKFLHVSRRQVAERYAMMPDFPMPIRLPSPKGRGIYRWYKHDILRWISELQNKAT